MLGRRTDAMLLNHGASSTKKKHCVSAFLMTPKWRRSIVVPFDIEKVVE
jgi:hypothetical protein